MLRLLCSALISVLVPVSLAFGGIAILVDKASSTDIPAEVHPGR